MRFILGILLTTLALTSGANAVEYVVEPDGSGDFSDIQSALYTVVPGDVILLADGEFSGVGNRDLDFMGKAVTVRSQNGSADACIIRCDGDVNTPHIGFIFDSDEGADSQIRDITIRDGYGINGGAIRCQLSSPFIYGVKLHNNIAHDQGGAIYCGGGAPAIESCEFKYNIAMNYYGGALSCEDGSPSLINCLFDANTSYNRGGAVRIIGNSEIQFTQCIFTNNHSAIHGGAIYMNGLANYGAQPEFDECIFAGNSSAEFGGAIVTIWTSAIMRNCEIYGNTAGEAGAIWCGGDTAAPELTNCTIAYNSGSAVGAIYCNAQSEITLNNCIVAFSDNGASFVTADGSVVYIQCTDIFGNEGGDWVAEIYGQYGQDGNISLDPQFCDVAADDYSLADSSPCDPFSAPNEECDQIGALPVGCGGSSLVAPTSWGEMKAMFR